MNTENTITTESVKDFEKWLVSEERSTGTIQKYLRDIAAFSLWLKDNPITKESVTAWKEYLLEENYAPVTINSMLATVNTYCRFADINVGVKYLKIQRKIFCKKDRELTKKEYEKLIETALCLGKHRIAMIIET